MNVQRIFLAAVASLAIPAAFAAPAVIISDQGCGTFDANGGFVLAFNNDKTVSTQSANDNVKLTCKFTNVPNNTGRAVNYDSTNNPSGPGSVCGILDPLRGFRVTTDWKSTISASGNVTLTCSDKL